MKTEIITLLRQRASYVSGQELCEKFGVSRTAVWKAIEQLKKDGYNIEAIKNRGYLLKEDTTPVFGRTEIESRLKTEWAGRTLYYYDSTDSTNVQIKRLAEDGAPHGTLAVADHQSAGRGRRGRAWDSPAGTNLYFSLLLRPEIAPDKASMLTLVMALAVATGIRRITTPEKQDSSAPHTGSEHVMPAPTAPIGSEHVMPAPTAPIDSEHANTAPSAHIGIKWPNDIVIDGRKACGILTEMSLSVEQGSIDHVVIGCGINVAKQNFPEELQGHAIALEEAFGRINRSKLLNDVLTAFEGYYAAFMKTEDLSGLKDDYNALLVNNGRQVRVLDPKGEYDGVARGICETGELIVELPDKEIKNVYAGEVSVRGIYGYV